MVKKGDGTGRWRCGMRWRGWPRHRGSGAVLRGASVSLFCAVAVCERGLLTLGGYGVAAGAVAYTSTVYVQTPTSQAPVVYTTVYVGGAAATTTKTSTTNLYDGVYCSTITEKGSNLPTTIAGSCGTVLVVNAGAILVPSRMLYPWGALAIVLVHLTTWHIQFR